MSERAAVVSGIGQSDVGRRLYRQPLDLTVDAALAAIADAGLTRDDIDGLATYPGNMDTPPGFSGVGVVISSGVKRFFSHEFSFSEATRA